jgi:hypothetical protein
MEELFRAGLRERAGNRGPDATAGGTRDATGAAIDAPDFAMWHPDPDARAGDELGSRSRFMCANPLTKWQKFSIVKS